MGRSVAQLQASVHDIPVSGIDTDILRLAVHCLETSQIGDPEPSVRFDLTYDTAKRIQVGCKDQGLPFSADFGENAPLPGNGGMESHFLQGILCVFRDFSRKTGRTVDRDQFPCPFQHPFLFIHRSCFLSPRSQM